jgi:hypothetical protein
MRPNAHGGVSGVCDSNRTRTDERRGSERHRCLGLAHGATVDEAQNGGHGVVADERAVGEGAWTMSGHAA